MTAHPPEAGAWLKPFDDVFLGLDASAVIQQVVGMIDPGPGSAVQGLTWPQFVQQYAHESFREGLKIAWIAMAEKRVAPPHWSHVLPFKAGMIVRLRPIEGDPGLSFAAHLSTAGAYNLLNTLFGIHLFDAMDRTVHIGQHLYRGVDGPLTDLQVKTIGEMINCAGYTRQLLKDLRAAVLLPAVATPLPYSLRSLLAFSSQDFSNRRITTQQLAIHSDLAAEAVYCHDSIRDVIRHVLEMLFTAITPQTTITVSSTVEEDNVLVKVEYISQEPAFLVDRRFELLELSDPARPESMTTIQRLVMGAQACLKPVGGRAWAEPDRGIMRLALVLPRWKGTLPELPQNI